MKFKETLNLSSNMFENVSNSRILSQLENLEGLFATVALAGEAKLSLDEDLSPRSTPCDTTSVFKLVSGKYKVLGAGFNHSEF